MITITDKNGTVRGSVDAIGSVTDGTLIIDGAVTPPPIIIGPASALPYLRSFFTTLGPDGNPDLYINSNSDPNVRQGDIAPLNKASEMEIISA